MALVVTPDDSPLNPQVINTVRNSLNVTIDQITIYDKNRPSMIRGKQYRYVVCTCEITSLPVEMVRDVVLPSVFLTDTELYILSADLNSLVEVPQSNPPA